jgi:hypothetical protein
MGLFSCLGEGTRAMRWARPRTRLSEMHGKGFPRLPYLWCSSEWPPVGSGETGVTVTGTWRSSGPVLRSPGKSFFLRQPSQ